MVSGLLFCKFEITLFGWAGCYMNNKL